MASSEIDFEKKGPVGFDSEEEKKEFYRLANSYKQFEDLLGLQNPEAIVEISPLDIRTLPMFEHFLNLLDAVSGGEYNNLTDEQETVLARELTEILSDRNTFAWSLTRDEKRQSTPLPYSIVLKGSDGHAQLDFRFKKGKKDDIKLDLSVSETSKIDDLPPLNLDVYRQRVEFLKDFGRGGET